MEVGIWWSVTFAKRIEELEKEMATFVDLAGFHFAKDEEVTEPLNESHLIPSQEDLKFMHFTAAFERQFGKKVQQYKK